MNRLVDRAMDFIEYKVCATLFGIVVVLVCVQVFCRVSGISLTWTEELARYLNTWSIYFCTSRCVKNSKHLSVEILPLVLKGKAKIALAIFVDIVCLAFFVYVGYFGVEVLNNLMLRPQRTAALQINMVYAYAAPVVGMVMMSIRTIQKIIEHSKEYGSTNIELEGGAA